MRPSILPFAILFSTLLAACGGSTEEEGTGSGVGGGAAGGPGVGGVGDGDGDGVGGAGEDECEGSPPGEGCPTRYLCFEGDWICDCSVGCETQATCPDERPDLGTYSCGYGLPTTCSYDASDICPDARVLYTCSSGTLTDPTYSGCDCHNFEDADSCAAGPCRWLEPGCDDNPAPLNSAGCFPVEDCVEGQCPESDEVCTPVSVLPDCEGEGCEACSIVENLCVSAP